MLLLSSRLNITFSYNICHIVDVTEKVKGNRHMLIHQQLPANKQEKKKVDTLASADPPLVEDVREKLRVREHMRIYQQLESNERERKKADALV